MDWWRRKGTLFLIIIVMQSMLLAACESTPEGGGTVVKTLVRYFGEVKEKAGPDSATVVLSLRVYRKRWKENTLDPSQKELLSESGPMQVAEKPFTVSFQPQGERNSVAAEEFKTDRNGMLTVDFPLEVMKLGQEKKGAWIYVKSADGMQVEFEAGYPQVSAETLAIWYFKYSQN
ncbi:MAG: hypothetical protein ACYS99_04660 [Planctomycetota bacterium]|jgi:predicted small secreted protein